jgi:MFS family permease
LVLARIIALAMLAHMGLVSARMTGSLYALANSASTFTVGVMIALFSLVPMLIAVRAGRWLDAVGPWRPTLVGMLLVLGGMSLPALFPYANTDVAPLLVCAALVGTGCMLVMLAAQRMVGEYADPNNRAAAFSWFALGASVSGFVGPVMSGALIDSVGHRATFAVLTVIALLAVVALWFNRELLPERTGEAKLIEPRHPLELLSHPALRRVMFATALVSMSWELQTFAIPVHGSRVGLSASQIGLVLGSFALATFAVRLAMPRLSRRYTEWQVLIFTLLSSSVSFALFPFFSSFVPLVGITFVLGLGLGAAQPNIMSLLYSRSPSGRLGESLGLRLTIINTSQVALPLVLGAFGSVLGTIAMFWSMALVAGLGGGVALRWREHEPGGAPQDAQPVHVEPKLQERRSN